MIELIYTHRNSEKRIAAIEYRSTGDGKWVPFQVVLVNPQSPNWVTSNFDFDWCKRDEAIYFHCSGSGGEGLAVGEFADVGKPDFEPQLLWIDRALIRPIEYAWDKEDRKELSDGDLAAKGYKVISKPARLFGSNAVNPFHSSGPYHAWEGETYWCSICEDRLPDEEDSKCRHVFWNEEFGLLDGPGAEEQGSCAEIEEQEREKLRVSLFALFDVMPRDDVYRLKEGVTKHIFRTRYSASLLGPTTWYFYLDHEGQNYPESIYCRFLNDLDDEDEAKMQLGFSWLTCLFPGQTTETDDLIAAWINQWLHESHR